MLNFTIKGQRIDFCAPVVASGSWLKLEADFEFTPEWEGLWKIAVFGIDGELYPFELTGDKIRAEDGLSLREGIWGCSVYGFDRAISIAEATPSDTPPPRLSTNIAIFNVQGDICSPGSTPSPSLPWLDKLVDIRGLADQAAAAAKAAEEAAANTAAVAEELTAAVADETTRAKAAEADLADRLTQAEADNATQTADIAELERTKADAIATEQAIRKIDREAAAVFKMLNGQVNDVETIEQSGTTTPPTGAMYMTPLEVYGKSEQVTTEGRQLIQYPYKDTTKTTNGVTFTDNGDGSITINGTATGLAYFYVFNQNPIDDALKQELTLNTSGIDQMCAQQIIINNADGTTSGGFYYNPRANLDASNAINAYHRIIVRADTTVQNRTVRPMLEYRTDNPHDWEPYTGGMPSPSKTYPQTIRGITAIHITHNNDSRTITFDPPLYSSGENADKISVDGKLTRVIKPITEDDYAYNINTDTEHFVVDPVVTQLSADDRAYLKSLELTPSTGTITITDQDGNDVSYLVEYLVNLKEVM